MVEENLSAFVGFRCDTVMDGVMVMGMGEGGFGAEIGI